MIIYKPVWFLYFLGLGHLSLFVQGLDQDESDQYADFQLLFPGDYRVLRMLLDWLCVGKNLIKR